MKNFKIAMILVAAVAFFCSCGGKEGPSITFAEKDGIATYDLSQGNSLTLNFEGSVTAEAGIESLKVIQTINDAEGTAVKAFELPLTEDPAGKTEFTFTLEDVLMKVDTENDYSLASGYTVVYDVTCADKKEQTETKSWTVTITETATPLPTAWNPTKVVLCSQSQSGYGITYEGVAAKVEDETIGVKCLGKNDHKDYNMYAEPTAGASWVFVESIEGLTTNEALVEAYNNGTVVTSRTMFPATDEGKVNFTEKYFISKNKNGEYVLVDYCAGRLNTTSGNVMVFQYKMAETTPAAAK
ncbi:MAG: hypothetical protein J6W06_02410 [Bacteroidales bacterium]|nr:hypothetical protein [Bacteroidales bacterium]